MSPDSEPFPWLWPLTAGLQLGAATLEIISKMVAAPVPSGAPCPEEPCWTTINSVVLDLPALRVREFAAGHGPPVILAVPFALHGPVLADLAPGHSIVERLLECGIDRLMLVECKSADPRMAFLDVDDYLAQVAVVLNEVGEPAALVGLCQGGWLSLMVAARFPSMVSRLVLVGSPIDLDAASSSITAAARAMPLEAFQTIVENQHGRVIGRWMLDIWKRPDTGEQRRLRHTAEPSAVRGRARALSGLAWLDAGPSRIVLSAGRRRPVPTQSTRPGRVSCPRPHPRSRAGVDPLVPPGRRRGRGHASRSGDGRSPTRWNAAASH